MFDGLVAFAVDRWCYDCGTRRLRVHITARVTNEGRKVRSGYLPFRMNASTLPITPKRSTSRDVGTSSYRYHTTTIFLYGPAGLTDDEEPQIRSDIQVTRMKPERAYTALLTYTSYEPARGLLATDHVILNHGQVTWTTPDLASPLLTTTPHQREDISALDRFNVHRCPTRCVFSGTGLELVTRQATVRYLYHSATAAGEG
ncbi:uncharacterized protein TNCV_1359901 [Trichonephila clavipes]|nr:uncharacterized protein TNCV_1359901 [Trichonephila clavipes]